MEDFNVNEYLDITESADFLGYCEANVTRLVRTGKIKAVKRGRKYLIHIDELNNYIKAV